jgi:hypothetical protein
LTNAQEAPRRDDRPWFLGGHKTAKLAQKTQAVHDSLPCKHYIGPDDGIGNDRVVRVKVRYEEPIEIFYLPLLLKVAISGSALKLKEPPDMGGQR